mgnify:CR=1 FL=1
MKRIYLIMLMIAAMMVSCNPKDEDDNNNSGGNGNNGGGSAGEIAGHGYVDLGLPSGLKWARRMPSLFLCRLESSSLPCR